MWTLPNASIATFCNLVSVCLSSQALRRSLQIALPRKMFYSIEFLPFQMGRFLLFSYLLSNGNHFHLSYGKHFPCPIGDISPCLKGSISPSLQGRLLLSLGNIPFIYWFNSSPRQWEISSRKLFPIPNCDNAADLKLVKLFPRPHTTTNFSPMNIGEL